MRSRCIVEADGSVSVLTESGERGKKKKILNAAFTFTLYCHNITVAHAPTCTCGCSRCSTGYRQAHVTQFTPLYCQYKIRPAAQTVLIKLVHTYTRHIQHNGGGGGGGVCLSLLPVVIDIGGVSCEQRSEEVREDGVGAGAQ